MTSWQFSTTTLLLLTTAAALWLYSIVEFEKLTTSAGYRLGWFLILLVHLAITAAFYRPLREARNGFALSAMLAGEIVLIAMLLLVVRAI